MKIHSFDLGEWWRATRPFMCRCGHARAFHASGRGRCARCPTCEAPVRMTRWSALLLGYRLGLAAGRTTAPVSTVVLGHPEPAEAEPPTVRIEPVSAEPCCPVVGGCWLCAERGRAEGGCVGGDEHDPYHGGPW